MWGPHKVTLRCSTLECCTPRPPRKPLREPPGLAGGPGLGKHKMAPLIPQAADRGVSPRKGGAAQGPIGLSAPTLQDGAGCPT